MMAPYRYAAPDGAEMVGVVGGGAGYDSCNRRRRQMKKIAG